MEDLNEICEKRQECEKEMECMIAEMLGKLRSGLWGPNAVVEAVATAAALELTSASPQQTTKRAKRLSSLPELRESSVPTIVPLEETTTSLRKTRSKNTLPLAADPMPMDAEPQLEPTLSEQVLMPPPAAPVVATVSEPANLVENCGRPQRAAKLKSEKNLKEPKLNQKMRRPSNLEDVKVKMEHEQRQSQLLGSTITRESTKSTLSARSEDSVLVIEKQTSVMTITSDEELTDDKEEKRTSASPNKGRQLRIMVKREKLSNGSSSAEETATNVQKDKLAVPAPKILPKSEAVCNESSMQSTTVAADTTTNTTTNTNKKLRKKKDVPKPIKVERFSDIDKSTLPISARTRKASESERAPPALEGQRHSGSVYEDAVENLPESTANGANVNETVTIAAAEKPNGTMVIATGVPNDATFCANPAQSTFVVENQPNPNATVTLETKSGSMSDATFNVPPASKKAEVSMVSSKNSMETAKDTTQPQHDDLITDDDSFQSSTAETVAPLTTKTVASKVASTKIQPPLSAKAYKMPTRTNELFNPLIQSPVKKKVAAFENAANAASAEQQTRSTRQKRTKENATPSQTNGATPLLAKAHTTALGRFLTPTQITPNVMAQPKKTASSASKAMPFPTKAATLKVTSSASSSKPLSRENSAEDFRKGLHNLAEERKKQREQKHLLVAQQREVKERERAERMAKVAKEREEKRLQKKMETEQKKREIEEINRKLRQQEEAAASESTKAKAAKNKAIVEQERDLLQQMKQQSTSAAKQRMMPPPPRVQSKYTFEMLHEDDSTDDEGKTSYKRPPPPKWSLRQVRDAAIMAQEFMPTNIIDSFFSVQPMTPDLKQIFPDIDPRHLKRNSSVLWSTPPRYSELPKY